MLLSADKAAAWARPAGRIGGSGHLGERVQRLAAAGGLLRVWGELPPSFSTPIDRFSGGGRAVVAVLRVAADPPGALSRRRSGVAAARFQSGATPGRDRAWLSTHACVACATAEGGGLWAHLKLHRGRRDCECGCCLGSVCIKNLSRFRL